MERTRSKAAPATRFDHAKDLPEAYRALSEALAAVMHYQENGPFPFIARQAKRPQDVAFVSTIAHASTWIRLWTDVREAAERVDVAINGRRAA